MNKQEAIKRVEQMGEYERFVDEPVSKKSVLNIISQIHEPKKVVVPKFVADWYEDHKHDFEYSLYDICFKYTNRKLNVDLHKWFRDEDNKPFETLVMMHKFGYEVKKEKLYAVEIPNPNGSGYSKIYLAKNKDGKVELFTWSGYTSIEFADNWKQEENAQLTESEIKKDFEWAWDFAEGVEELNE